MAFIEVKPEKLNVNIFNMIKNWMVLTAGDPDDCNSMIVSWGGMGIMWGRPAATVYVRNSRYTLDFMNKDEYFTLSILPETYKSEMGYLGSHSGRDGCFFAFAFSQPFRILYQLVQRNLPEGFPIAFRACPAAPEGLLFLYAEIPAGNT